MPIRQQREIVLDSCPGPRVTLIDLCNSTPKTVQSPNVSPKAGKVLLNKLQVAKTPHSCQCWIPQSNLLTIPSAEGCHVAMRSQLQSHTHSVPRRAVVGQLSTIYTYGQVHATAGSESHVKPAPLLVARCSTRWTQVLPTLGSQQDH